MATRKKTPTRSDDHRVSKENARARRRIRTASVEFAHEALRPRTLERLRSASFSGSHAKQHGRNLNRMLAMLQAAAAAVENEAEIVTALSEDHPVHPSEEMILVAWDVLAVPTASENGPRWVRTDWDGEGEAPIAWPVPETYATGNHLAGLGRLCLGTLSYVSAEAVCILLDLTAAGCGLTALAVVDAQRARPIEERYVLGMTDRGMRLTVNRWPAIGDLVNSTVAALNVDGEPMVSDTLGLRVAYRRRRAKRRTLGARQTDLPQVGTPQSLDGREVNDVLIAALREALLTGDERSLLRGDLTRCAALAFALSGPTLIPERFGAQFLGGQPTPANVKRFWHAAQVLRSFTIKVDAVGRWLGLATVDTDPAEGVVYLAPPAWWKGKGKHNAHRMSGRLWRRAFHKGDNSSGPGPGYWSGLDRTLNGLEAEAGQSQLCR